MKPIDYFKQEWQSHHDVWQKTFDATGDDFQKMVLLCAQSIRAGGKILFFGNGGSAADAQHLAAELTGRYTKDRDPIAAIALTTDTSALTAIGNDYGYEYVFSRQLKALGKKGDVAIGISTSGKSPSVIEAFKVAKELGVHIAGFVGGTGGLMKDWADPLIIVPSTITARIQEMHILLGHSLCAALEQELGMV